jgi:hypothetical protein
MNRLSKAARRHLLQTLMAARKREFGIVGDGYTDDTEALQLAIDTDRSSRRGLRRPMPEGVYHVTKTLRFPPRRRGYLLVNMKFIVPPHTFGAGGPPLLRFEGRR